MEGSMDRKIKNKFEGYPEAARSQLLAIRTAIFEVAAEESLGEIVESLKWGEPSYLSKAGSAVRMDWKAKSPATVSIYFNCQSLLIETFKEIYGDTFEFVGKREIVFQLSRLEAHGLPIAELKACLSMAMRYHDIKHLPLLGQ